MSEAERASRGGPLSWADGATVDGRYRVLGVAGEGAMGRVLRVRHLEWRIDLAVKCPNEDWFETPRQRELFVAEAEAWVGLGLHPNICGCHYVRVLDGVPRVFAEYVADGSLHDWITGGRLYEGGPEAALPRVLDVAVQMAWGLGHAHARNLVHQDVKPANVLIAAGSDGSVVAKVTDFGLARARRGPGDGGPARDTSSPEVSVPVSFGGMTRAYASPEQLARRPLGRRTDVFSFAVSVLEMVTGGATWGLGPMAGDVLAACRAGEVPAALGPIPSGLADLLERCLRTDPGQRPASMTEVGADLVRLHHEMTGRRYPRLEPEAADLRGDEFNNRALSLLDLDRPDDAEEAFASALSADPQHTAATFNAGMVRWRRGDLTDDELVARVDAVRRDTEDSRAARHVLGLVHLERGDLTAARPLLERPGTVAAADLGSGNLVDARCLGVRDVPWTWERPGMADPLLTVDVSADGRRAVTAGVDDGIQVWDVPTGRRLHTLAGHASTVRRVRVTPDGRYAASVGGDRSVRLWELDRGTCLRTIRTAGTPSWAAVGARAGIAVYLEHGRSAGRPSVSLVVQDLRTRQVRWRFEHDVFQFTEAELSPDGHRVLVSGYADCAARLWDLETGRCEAVLGDEGANRPCVAFHREAGVAALGSHRGSGGIEVWDLRTGRLLRTLAGPVRPPASLAFGRGGSQLLAGGGDGTVRLWDVATGRCLRTFAAHDGAVRRVQWGADDAYALSAGQDNAMRLWRLPGVYRAQPQLSRPRAHGELSESDDKVEGLVDEAARLVAAGDRAGALDRLSAARAVPGHERAANVLAAWRSLGTALERTGVRGVWSERSFSGHRSALMTVGVAADGRLAASGGLDGTVCVWNLATGHRLLTLKPPVSRGPHDAVDVVQVSADGARVMAACRDGSVHAWSVATGELLHSLDGERVTAVDVRDPLLRMIGPLSRGPRATRFTADGRRALVGGADRAFRLWDLAHGTCRRTLVGDADRVQYAWPAADGLLAATASGTTVRLWNLFSGRCLHVLRGHEAPVSAVALSGDGRLVVSCGGYEDHTLRLWDAASGRCLRVLTGHEDSASAVVFTPDGRHLLSGAGDSTLRIWEVSSGRCLRVVEAHAGAVQSVATTDDGQAAVTGGDDGVVRVWTLDWELAVR